MYSVCNLVQDQMLMSLMSKSYILKSQAQYLQEKKKLKFSFH